MNKRPTILAFYLPQYYPFKENDEWWGKGFTEWTSVGRAKPLFKGHYQPKVPADLSYYDLRLPIVREQQAEMAKQYGIDGFCYWHYWFGNGKRLLDLVETEVVESGKPDYPFCFCWANHTWYSKNWNRKDSKFGHQILLEQLYPGAEDYEAHFYCCLNAFKDKRYIQVDGKPVFAIYDAASIPDIHTFFEVWTRLAIINGFKGIYFISYNMNIAAYNRTKNYFFDEYTVDVMNAAEKPISNIKKMWRHFINKLMLDDKLLSLRIIPYSDYRKKAINFFKNNDNISPCLLPNYDHSPRSGKNAIILADSTPEEFGLLLIEIRELLERREHPGHFLFIKSWNEWGEGNYLEPDMKYGRGYLEKIRDVYGIQTTTSIKR